MLTMDVVGRARMKQHIGGLAASGSTDMGSGLETAFDVLETSAAAGATAGCNRVVLFLTDGQNTGERDPAAYAASRNLASSLSARIFTYSFGDGAARRDDAVAVMKRIACENEGVWQAVPDGGDLRTVMASYFTYLAAGNAAAAAEGAEGAEGGGAPVVRWSDWFEDGQGLGQIAGACGAVYDRRKSAREGIAHLFGVVCVSIAKPTWDAFADGARVWAEVQAKDRQCPSLSFGGAKLELIRRHQFGEASACGAGSPGADAGGVAVAAAVGVAAAIAAAIVLACQVSRRGKRQRGRPHTSSGVCSTHQQGAPKSTNLAVGAPAASADVIAVAIPISQAPSASPSAPPLPLTAYPYAIQPPQRI